MKNAFNKPKIETLSCPSCGLVPDLDQTSICKSCGSNLLDPYNYNKLGAEIKEKKSFSYKIHEMLGFAAAEGKGRFDP